MPEHEENEGFASHQATLAHCGGVYVHPCILISFQTDFQPLIIRQTNVVCHKAQFKARGIYFEYRKEILQESFIQKESP